MSGPTTEQRRKFEESRAARWWGKVDYSDARDVLLLTLNPIPKGVCHKCGQRGAPHHFLCPGEEY